MVDAEERYQTAPCGLLTITSAGDIVLANRTFCAWLGYGEENIRQMRFHDLLTMGSKVFHQTHWMPLLQIQGSVAEVQFELVRSDGSVVPMLINASRRTDAAISAGSTLIDIATFVATDRRKYERELLAARKRAEELLESERQAQQRTAELMRLREQESRQRAILAEQLVGIVSHDLRNPLNTILLGASLLKSAELPEHARTIKRIDAAAERATRLIADLLDFTQARLGGGLAAVVRTVDMHAVIAECLEEVRFAWPGRTVRHEGVGAGEVQLDPDRFAQVVSNLVNNAMVYGRADTPVVVTSAVSDTEVKLCVHNYGPAIPIEKQAQLFEPLSRGEKQLNQGFRSVGLGLYIVREVAKAHHGDVTVSSNETEGTTFIVTLPRPS